MNHPFKAQQLSKFLHKNYIIVLFYLCLSQNILCYTVVTAGILGPYCTYLRRRRRRKRAWVRRRGTNIDGEEGEGYGSVGWRI